MSLPWADRPRLVGQPSLFSTHMKLGITGHRPQKLGGFTRNALWDVLRARIRVEFLRFEPHEVITGMALGWDQWAAQAAYDLGIPYTAALPCDDQDAKWAPEWRDQYAKLLRTAKRIHLVSPGPYVEGKMQIRNEWVVDNSDFMLACWDGSAGGTYKTVKYAWARKRDVIRIDPTEDRSRLL